MMYYSLILEALVIASVLMTLYSNRVIAESDATRKVFFLPRGRT